MSRHQQLIIFGIALVIVGFLLLVLGDIDGEGFVLVFPFVFTTGSTIFSFVLGLGVFLVFLIAFWVMFIKPGLEYREDSSIHFTGERPLDSVICSVCGEQLPNRAKFCLNCGTQMNSSSHND